VTHRGEGVRLSVGESYVVARIPVIFLPSNEVIGVIEGAKP
jgi:hypothetical protein